MQVFNMELRRALRRGAGYDAETIDTALNEVTERYFVENLRRSLDFEELFALAVDYAVHDEAVQSGRLEPMHGLRSFRGAGESAGGALADAIPGFGPLAVRELEELRSSLTETCLKRAESEPENRIRMLAWLSGFRNTAKAEHAEAATRAA